MSIFRSTLKPYICRQLNARQDLISSDSNARSDKFIQYNTARNAWVRMISFVDFNGNGYKGSELAKKYILEAGTLYHNEATDTYSLRGGFANKGGSYGGNVGDRQFGIVPMPGITKVEVKTKSAYGSLREAVVEFIAHDKKQQEDLEILFMRPGFAVLLEWGWSMYLNTYKNDEKYYKEPDAGSVIESMPLSAVRLQNYDGGGIDAFSVFNQQEVYDKIQFLQHKYSGNYSGMLGFVRNYSWEINKNGSYTCKTILISIGDVIDSIKTNSAQAIKLNDGNDETVKTEFERIIEAAASAISAGTNPKLNDILNIPYIDSNIYSITAGTGNSKKTRTYIQFGLLIGILNTFFSLYEPNGSAITSIELPFPIGFPNIGNGYCLASEDSITINPDFCIIKNARASFVTGLPDGFDILKQQLNNNFDLDKQQPIDTSISVLNLKTGTSSPFYTGMNEFLDNFTKFGVTGNVYLEKDAINDIFKEVNNKNNGYVSLREFIHEILIKISFALGSINDFDLYIENNKAVVIDKHYLEDPKDTVKEKKFKFNVIGKNSILRDFSISSKIFPSQATMIAVAAQSRVNLGSVQSSTNGYLNRGVSNRLLPSLSESDNKNQVAVTDDDIRAEKLELAERVLAFKQYVIENIFTLNPKAPNIDSANNLLNSIILKINTDTNFKGIIPVSLNFTMDGLGGYSIGEIFTINPDILPKDYENKNLGFIITGIEDRLEKSDWLTTINTLVCLLDQDKLQSYSININKNEFAKEIEQHKQDLNKNFNLAIIAYRLLVAFIEDYYFGSIRITIQQTSTREGLFIFQDEVIPTDIIPVIVKGSLAAVNVGSKNFGHNSSFKDELESAGYDLTRQRSTLASFDNFATIALNNLIVRGEYDGPEIKINSGFLAFTFQDEYKLGEAMCGTPVASATVLSEIIKTDNDLYKQLSLNSELKNDFDAQFEILKQQAALITNKDVSPTDKRNFFFKIPSVRSGAVLLKKGQAISSNRIPIGGFIPKAINSKIRH